MHLWRVAWFSKQEDVCRWGKVRILLIEMSAAVIKIGPVGGAAGEKSGGRDIVGQLDEMCRKTSFIRQRFSLIIAAAYSDSLICICGERGTEKAHLARLVHALSDRDGSPFIRVDCSGQSGGRGISEPGSALGTTWPRIRGIAAGGSIFIDRVEILDRRGQFFLKNILEKENHLRRVGEPDILSSPRLILGAAEDLERRVEAGTFLPELYYTMMVVEIAIPPLRERREDIIPLIRLVVGSTERGRSLIISPEAEKALISYDWPGNFDELEWVAGLAVENQDEGIITGGSLPEKIRGVAARDAALLSKAH